METLTKEQPRTAAGESGPEIRRRSQAMALLVAMRPPEWIKNLLVFAGLLFSQKLDQGPQVAEAVITFVAFCAISSAGYLVNDLRDAPLDRRHPEKRRRRIASRELSESLASVAAIVLAAVAIGISFAWVSAG